MARRIGSMSPRLSSLAPRLGFIPGDRAGQDKQREAVLGYRRWYRTQRWYDLRYEVLTRDKWMCQRTGVMLVGKHPAPNSPVIHHIVPHGGDEALFWSKGNLQAVSKAWHDTVGQREDIAHGRTR